MNEMIIRLNSFDSDVEIAYREDDNVPAFKKIYKDEFIAIFNDFLIKEKKVTYRKNLKLLDPSIIAIDNHFAVINQPERKRIVAYIDRENKIHTYKINFPNSLYIIEFTSNDDKIRKIECYSYKEFKKEKTELYEYPMPNELIRNEMCLGTADRKINNGNIVEALERIIFTPYSHSTFSGMNGFSQTETYFEFLENNDFPYKMMKPLNKRLEKVLKN